jgi:hypothetical protein
MPARRRMMKARTPMTMPAIARELTRWAFLGVCVGGGGGVVVFEAAGLIVLMTASKGGWENGVG